MNGFILYVLISGIIMSLGVYVFSTPDILEKFLTEKQMELYEDKLRDIGLNIYLLEDLRPKSCMITLVLGWLFFPYIIIETIIELLGGK